MTDSHRQVRAVVLSRHWSAADCETSFVMRSIAAAASRYMPVAILVPGDPGASTPDGLFDVVGVGSTATKPGAESHTPDWPSPSEARWPDDLSPSFVMTEGDDRSAAALAASWAPTTAVLPVVHRRRPGSHSDLVPLELGLPVPVNPLAAARPHNGFGFTDYLLVLSGRRSAPTDDRLTPAAAWLAAAFPREHLVVVENAVASAWRSRSLRGRVHVDSRTDLWRLLAHARVTVDLAPGPLIARECIESIRLATPIVVPADSSAAELASEGAGTTFRDAAELLKAVEALGDVATRQSISRRGNVRSAHHGDPTVFGTRLRTLLTAADRPGR
ncbi:MAG: hypothetical protein ACYCU7_02375 [Acidimicrobiales bacterium]